jgi:hypothetical protein
LLIVSLALLNLFKIPLLRSFIYRSNVAVIRAAQGLWSLALVGAGQAILSRPHPVAYWWWGPSAVALLGGWHHDSRFRRGIGGQFDPFYESQTSNVPLAAVLSGKQGPVLEALREVAGQDIKPLNAALGVAIASAWVYAASRGRVKLK